MFVSRSFYFSLIFIIAVFIASTAAFSPIRNAKLPQFRLKVSTRSDKSEPVFLSTLTPAILDVNATPSSEIVEHKKRARNSDGAFLMLSFGLTFFAIEPVHAAEYNLNAIPSAIAAYGHYLGIILMAVSLTAERLLVKAGMSRDEEDKVVIAEIVYGLAAIMMLFSGKLKYHYF